MKVKCQVCKVKDTEREDMVIETYVQETGAGKGSIKNKYYHKNCHSVHVAEKEFKEKERDELDSLVETMMEIHKISTIPTPFYPFLQSLRNGTVIFGKKKKKYKQGYSYALIEKTYIFCRESIEYWKKNKEFDSTMSELKYCWAIINDKISVVKKAEEKKEFNKAKKKAEEIEDQKINIITHQQKEGVEFKKTKREDNIADFL